MRRWRWAAVAVAGLVLAGSAGTQARWTAAATIPGAVLRTPAVVPPGQVTCAGGLLSWPSVPGATGYDLLAAGVEVPVTGTSYALSSLLTALLASNASVSPGGLGVSVEALFGSWRSDPSSPAPLMLGLGSLSCA